jgi:hypothetical protein
MESVKKYCDMCQNGIGALRAKEEEFIGKFGWYWHYVSGGVFDDVHTHHLQETYNHLDFDMKFPFTVSFEQHQAFRIIGKIFENLVKRIEKGEKFEAGQRVSEIIENFDVKLIASVNGGRPYLRIILPDPLGRLDEDEIDKLYARQYEGE